MKCRYLLVVIMFLGVNECASTKTHINSSYKNDNKNVALWVSIEDSIPKTTFPIEMKENAINIKALLTGILLGGMKPSIHMEKDTSFSLIKSKNDFMSFAYTLLAGEIKGRTNFDTIIMNNRSNYAKPNMPINTDLKKMVKIGTAINFNNVIPDIILIIDNIQIDTIMPTLYKQNMGNPNNVSVGGKWYIGSNAGFKIRMKFILWDNKLHKEINYGFINSENTGFSEKYSDMASLKACMLDIALNIFGETPFNKFK